MAFWINPDLGGQSFESTRLSHLSHLVRSGPGGYPSRIARLSTATSADRLIAFLPMRAVSGAFATSKARRSVGSVSSRPSARVPV